MRHRFGFTLAELLVALLILGEIATFTIPKILTAQQNGSNKAKVKEAASMVAAAYQLYQSSNSITSGFQGGALTPYLNYIALDATSTIDDVQTQTTSPCSAALCLKLHSGAMLMMPTAESFGGTATTNAIWLQIDPDGRVTDGTTNGPGKSVSFWLYTNGRLIDRGNLLSGTASSLYVYSADPSRVPSWFSW